MAHKPVNLAVHRNTKWKRDQHAVSAELMAEAKKIAAQKGVAGFVLIAWNGDGETTISANLTAEIIPIRAIPAYVMQELQARLLTPIKQADA